MPVIYQKMIFRGDLRKNPDVLYLFGDNDRRIGFGGQAGEMRDEPNAVGIRTKWNPGMSPADFFSDRQYKTISGMIDADFARPFEYLRRGKIVIVPADGLGTGLSELPTRAPKVNDFLLAKLGQLAAFGVDD
jgi:hypothetical protein